MSGASYLNLFNTRHHHALSICLSFKTRYLHQSDNNKTYRPELGRRPRFAAWYITVVFLWYVAPTTTHHSSSSTTTRHSSSSTIHHSPPTYHHPSPHSTTMPRNESSCVGTDSPSNNALISKGAHASHKMNRADNHRELRRSMHGKIAIMPYTTFMKAFVPDPRLPGKRFRKCRTAVFEDMKAPKSEAEMYREIVSIRVVCWVVRICA